MLKTSARRREIVRRSKEKHPPKKIAELTPEERERVRRYFREKRREYRECRQYEEKRRARRWRDRQLEKLGAGELQHLADAGIGFINQKSLRHDLTRWIGPGAGKERQLEREADNFLQENGYDNEARKKRGPTTVQK